MTDGINPTHVVKCKWCDTELEWTQGGQRWQFTVHTEEFCRDATRQLVQDLKRAMRSMQETLEHRMRNNQRLVHEYLKKHGLPTQEEKGEALRKIAYAQSLLTFVNPDLGEDFE